MHHPRRLRRGNLLNCLVKIPTGTTEYEGNMKKIFIIATILLMTFQSNTGVIAASDSGKGNVKIEPAYDGAYHFSDGLALVKMVNQKIEYDDYVWIEYKYGYIDKDGNIAIPIRYDFATPFINGNAVVERYSGYVDEDENWNKGTRYWISPNGKYFLKEALEDFDGIDSAEPFCEGLALVKFGDLTVGSFFIDKKGNYVINTYNVGTYSEFAGSFSEGLAVVYSYFGNSDDFWNSKHLRQAISIKKMKWLLHKNLMMLEISQKDLRPFVLGINGDTSTKTANI